MENKSSNAQVDGRALDLITQIIQEIGDDPLREGLLDTPKRVVKSWKELYAGYLQDPKKILGTTFDAEKYDQIVICKDIELFSTCEHHMLPFIGKIHIGYLPGSRVVGLSKLARLADCFARRLQIQERLTHQIASTLDEVLKPRGVMVVLEAKHFCMCARGVQKQHSSMVTSATIGIFRKSKAARDEFMSLIK